MQNNTLNTKNLPSPLSFFNQGKALSIIYLYILYFSLPFQLMLAVSGNSGYTGLRDCIIFTTTLALIPVLFKKHTKLYLLILGGLLYCASVVHFFYFFVFGQEISESIYYIIFETNNSEGMEFIGNYINYKIIAFVLVYLIPPIFLFKKIKPANYSKSFCSILLLIVFCINLQPYIKKQSGFNKNSLQTGTERLMAKYTSIPLMQYIFGYYAYKQQLDSVNKLISTIKNQESLESIESTDKNKQQTYVLVIGESTNKGRMGIYGYHRNTSPLLTTIANELMIFKDVVTPKPSTIAALSLVLTFDSSSSHGFYPNAVTMMKEAGFKTYWITNQQTMSDSNTLLTTYSKLSDKSVYLNQNRNQSAKSFDEKVIAPFKDALLDKSNKKFIVIHLLGTHGQYRFRYPSDYSIFDNNNQDISKYAKLSQANSDYYNQYDNAVLYNDYVLYNIINTFKQSKNYGGLMYFSDHGEEVFDVKDFHGRNEADPTEAMYTIPFLIWLSDDYKQTNHFTNDNEILNKKYSTLYFTHTLCEMTHLKYKYCDYSKSVLNKEFSTKKFKRYIGDVSKPIDYDAYFKTYS